MASTDFGALSDARKRIWAAETWKQGRDQSFWFSNGFVGSNENDMNSPIHRVTKLTETERGTECVMQLVADLVGDGVVGDNELEGNEEALTNDAQIIKVDQLRHGVKNKGKMSEQATVIRFRAQAREKLTFWLSDKVDEMLHLVGAGRAFTLNTDGSTRGASQLPSLDFASDVVAASANRITYAGAATSEGTIIAGDTMTWDDIVNTCAFAKRQKIKPIRSGGKEYYAIVMSTEQARDLKKDTGYQTNLRTAGPRGDKNKLFTGALAVIDGAILYEHNKTYNTLGAGGSSKWGAGGAIDGASALLFGSQAMGIATVGNSEMNESDNTDYGNRKGLAYGRMIGMLKPQFILEAGGTAEDFGIVQLKSAAAA